MLVNAQLLTMVLAGVIMLHLLAMSLTKRSVLFLYRMFVLFAGLQHCSV